MKKLAKGIMYAGGLAGAFIAGGIAVCAILAFRHEADGYKDEDAIIENDFYKLTVIGAKARNFRPQAYPAIFEIKEEP